MVVYNFEVTDFHSYYVSEFDVLVHNTCPKVKKVKTYQTYTKTNKITGKVYSGRTSGYGLPADNVAKRDKNHHMTPKGYGPAQLDRTSSNRQAIRGREQQLIDYHGGAQSTGGKSGNAINGIGDNNKKRKEYIKAAIKEFGKL